MKYRHTIQQILRSLIVVIAMVAVSIFSLSIFSPTVNAHRSGCHRWHSCPSDTGSYVCGDLGYSTYCGTASESTTSTAPLPDYASQGKTNGTNHANGDATTISSAAQEKGASQGESDGLAGVVANPAPNLSYCTREWAANSNTAAYNQAYHAAYTATCETIYTQHYSGPYQAAYATGQTKKQEQVLAATSAKSNAEAKKSGSGATWFWGVMIFIGIVVLLNRASRKRSQS